MIENNDKIGFCKNCLNFIKNTNNPCPTCSSRRITAHEEIFDLCVAHLDCDAFYAAIEKRDDPTLEHKPLIIGGTHRGVVSTCCYIARTYGVHSAMPMFKAMQACPDAVVLPPDFKKYSKIGYAIREMMYSLTPLVEPLSIDEAFLDLTGTQRIHKEPAAISIARLQNQIKDEIGITISVGLSHNKFLAKIASDFDKPNGFYVIGKAETETFLASQTIDLIWGIGKKTTQKLAQDGLKTIAQLQKMDPKKLISRYGETGLRLSKLAFGIDERVVTPERQTKSVSAETTLNRDLDQYKDLEDILWPLCEKVSIRMKEKGFFGRVLTLKLKTDNFKTITRRITLESATNLARTAFDQGIKMLAKECDGRRFRLIGIGYSDLSSANKAPPQNDFFAEDQTRLIAREQAMDQIREKFGRDSIGAARSFKKNTKKG